MVMASLVGAPTTCRVSSVLDRNKTLYGGDRMLSQDATTCWQSAQGSPQHILLQFHRRVAVRQLALMFQGGFVGQDVDVLVRFHGVDDWTRVDDAHVDPEDANELQRFACVAQDVTALQLRFGRSTDFYGRIVVYCLDVLGSEMEEETLC